MSEIKLDRQTKIILNSIQEGIYIIDKEFKIVFINDAAAKIVGVVPNNLYGKLCFNFCKSDRCEIGCPISEVLRSDTTINNLESTLQSFDGKVIPIKLNASLLKNDSDEPIGGIISFSKISKIDFIESEKNQQNFYGIIGRTKGMTKIYKSVMEISSSDVPVLITGETGTGKEMVANAIHKSSQRANKIFVKVNCSALNGELLESELFGHVRGAFTGAFKDRIGRFEYADGGTIFLDEIGEIPMPLQSKLLRILQDGTFERLGETKQRKVNVRVISATNIDINQAIENKSFRKDLYYRLNTIHFHIPPLRERKSDIYFLANYFATKYAKKYQKKISMISTEALNILFNYNWEGNVRELESVIEYSIIHAKREDYIGVCCLPDYLKTNSEIECPEQKMNFAKKEKKDNLLLLLRQNNWNKTKVAKILGVNRSTIYRQIKEIQTQ
jgi:PAS domain S-box-containing protein